MHDSERGVRLGFLEPRAESKRATVLREAPGLARISGHSLPKRPDVS